jgi:hypothetical protein
VAGEQPIHQSQKESIGNQENDSASVPKELGTILS